MSARRKSADAITPAAREFIDAGSTRKRAEPAEVEPPAKRRRPLYVQLSTRIRDDVLERLHAAVESAKDIGDEPRTITRAIELALIDWLDARGE